MNRTLFHRCRLRDIDTLVDLQAWYSDSEGKEDTTSDRYKTLRHYVGDILSQVAAEKKEKS